MFCQNTIFIQIFCLQFVIILFVYLEITLLLNIYSQISIDYVFKFIYIKIYLLKTKSFYR